VWHLRARAATVARALLKPASPSSLARGAPPLLPSPANRDERANARPGCSVRWRLSAGCAGALRAGGVPEWHKAELDRRLAEYEAAPDAGRSWKQVEATRRKFSRS
jgi:hypothetical protein